MEPTEQQPPAAEEAPPEDSETGPPGAPFRPDPFDLDFPDDDTDQGDVDGEQQ